MATDLLSCPSACRGFLVFDKKNLYNSMLYAFLFSKAGSAKCSCACNGGYSLQESVESLARIVFYWWLRHGGDRQGRT